MAAAHCLPVQSEMVRVTAWAVALMGKDCRRKKVSRPCRVPGSKKMPKPHCRGIGACPLMLR